MEDQDMFIGREKELHMIDEMVRDPERARHMLRIVGPAGVGKTWLLRKLYHRYRDDPAILVVRIDYGEARPQSLPGLSLHVIEQFGEHMSDKHKEDYHQRMANWKELLESEVDPDRIREEQNKIYLFGIDLIWQLSQEKRILILSDALDTENALEDIQRTNFMATNLLNTVMIFAGRPGSFTDQVYNELAELYRRWETHPVYNLGYFSEEESQSYLAASLPRSAAPELAAKVSLLTAGQPVLVALAAEWFQHNAALPEGVDMPLENMRALEDAPLHERRRQFEFALVEDIRALRHPIDRAILYRSYLNRRDDPRIFELVLDDVSSEELAALVDELKQRVVVRQSIISESSLLHLEVQRLLLEHVWPELDPDESQRHALARTVIDSYYLPEIERLNNIIQDKLAQTLKPTLSSATSATTERRDKLPIPDEYWPKRDLQIECLYYHFCISEQDGWNYLNQLFDEALTYHYSLPQMDALVQVVPRVAPQQVHSSRFQVRFAQILLEKGEVQRAARMAEQALDTDEIEPADAANAFIVLADATTAPAEKVTHFKVSLEMAEAAEDPVLEQKIHNRLGLAFRRQGHWKEAEQAYLQVLHMLDEQQDPNQYAATLNNLAFVYMLNGNLIRADNLAEKALRMRREQGNIHGLGFSYSTRGRIAEAMGNHVLAQRYHRTAVDLCELVGDTNNAALMQVNVAASECQAQKFEPARLLLARALRSDIPNIRARALQQAARVDVEEGRALTAQGAPPLEIESKYENAEQLATRALALAKEVLDDHLISSVLLDLIMITFLREKRKDAAHVAELQEILKDHDYKLEKGRLIELEGDLAYNHGEVVAAFGHYLEACKQLATYSLSSFRALFEQVRDKFFEASANEQQQICQMIEATFAETHPDSPLIALKDLCIDILVRF